MSTGDRTKKEHRIPHDFNSVRAALNGMLSERVYQEYYRVARDDSKGSILELGTGQGASTVAFALGIKDSGRSARVIAVDQFSQHSHGPHPASRETHGDATVGINLRAFEAGLRNFDVQDIVDIHVGTTENVADVVTAAIDSDAADKVDVLAIDVDGMLDRDLGLFYDCLQRGGLLILDDYANTINDRGQDELDQFRKLDAEGAAAKIGQLSSFKRRRLLGKHLLTYRFVERFEALGLLSKENVIGWTAFCRKPDDIRFWDRWMSAEGEAIESSVVEEFLQRLRVPDGPANRPVISRIKKGISRMTRRSP